MAYFHCLIGGGSSGGGYELTVTCDADFAGTTITATDGVTTLTQTCPSASPYEVVFAIPNGGEWTISGIISGQTYSASIDIPDSLELHSIPEGSTVLPTDDIQTWLACAGITDKSYTTLAEVLADSTTLLALMSDNNASDYLVRSTTFASDICADSTAMTDIGANNYCANTLLSDSTWASAICNSTYFESVLNTKVPTMTGATTPSGEASASNTYQSGYPWKAFNGTNVGDFDGWIGNFTSQYIPAWICYEFDNAVCVKKVYFENRNYSGDGNARIKTYKVQASNDNFVSDIHDLTDLITRDDSKNVAKGSDTLILDDNVDAYTSYRLYITERFAGAGSHVGCAILQFYGRADV